MPNRITPPAHSLTLGRCRKAAVTEDDFYKVKFIAKDTIITDLNEKTRRLISYASNWQAYQYQNGLLNQIRFLREQLEKEREQNAELFDKIDEQNSTIDECQDDIYDLAESTSTYRNKFITLISVIASFVLTFLLSMVLNKI